MFSRFIIILITVFLASCATQRLEQSEQEITEAKQQAVNSKKSVEELLVEYANKLEVLDEDNLLFYAPLTMQLASEKAAKAKHLRSNNSASLPDIKFELMSALHFLDKANMNKKAVKLHLKSADTHFTELKNLQAPSLLPLKFNKIESTFRQLSTLIETGKIQDAIKQEPDLIKEMIQVEIETLQKSYLDKAADYIQQAKENDASSYAPATLKEAEGFYQATSAFIQKSYRDKNTIIEKSEETLKVARKLYFISKETLAFHKSSNEEIEIKVINAYALLKELGVSLAIEPLEISQFSEQGAQLLKQIKITKEETSDLIKQLQAKNEALASNKQAVISVTPMPQLQSPKIIMSQETNKAVLSELFMPNSYSDAEVLEDENLEFDSIEIVK